MSHRHLSYEAELRQGLQHLLSAESKSAALSIDEWVAFADFIQIIPQESVTEKLQDTLFSFANGNSPKHRQDVKEALKTATLGEVDITPMIGGADQLTRKHHRRQASLQLKSGGVVNIPNTPVSGYSLGKSMVDLLVEERKKDENVSLKFVLDKTATNPAANPVLAKTYQIFQRGLFSRESGNFQAVGELIIQPFAQLALAESQDKEDLTAERCCSAFTQWFEQNKQFFTYLWEVQAHWDEDVCRKESLQDSKSSTELAQRESYFASIFSSAQQGLVTSFFNRPEVCQQGFSFFRNTDGSFNADNSEGLFRGILQDKFQKLEATYRRERIKGTNYDRSSSTLEYPGNEHLQKIIRIAHLSLQPMLKKSKKLHDQGLYAQSFALLNVAEQLKEKLDQLVGDLNQAEQSQTSVSSVEVKAAEDPAFKVWNELSAKHRQANASSAEVKTGEDPAFKVWKFLLDSQNILRGALTDKHLTEHKNLLMHWLSKIFHFFKTTRVQIVQNALKKTDGAMFKNLSLSLRNEEKITQKPQEEKDHPKEHSESASSPPRMNRR